MSEAESQLPQARKEASGALFIMAFLILGLTAWTVLLPHLFGMTVDAAEMAPGLALMGGLGAVFVGLGVWARFRPLPAAAVGLGLFAVLAVLSLLSVPERGGMGLAVLLLVEIVLGTLLLRAIRTCLKARRASS
jgi:hypothetical protein